jgi:hypothetical protein
MSRRLDEEHADETKLISYKINYPQKLWISWGLTNLESNGRSGLEVDWLFFAQDECVTDSRHRTEVWGLGVRYPWLPDHAHESSLTPFSIVLSKHAPCNGSFTDLNSTERTKHPEHVKHPQNDGDDNHNVVSVMSFSPH